MITTMIHQWTWSGYIYDFSLQIFTTWLQLAHFMKKLKIERILLVAVIIPIRMKLLKNDEAVETGNGAMISLKSYGAISERELKNSL